MTQISVIGAEAQPSPDSTGDQRTRGMRRLEERLGIDLEAFLRDQYEVQGRTQTEIASELKVDAATVSRWMTKLGIETRLFASERAAS